MKTPMRIIWRCGGCPYVASARSAAAAEEARKDHQAFVKLRKAS